MKKIWRYHYFTPVQQSFFVILGHFLTLLTTQKIKTLKKWKVCLKILSFYTNVPQMMIIWCMVPEIWSAKDWISCHFGLFFALLPPLNNPENKKMAGDIIILHKCTKNKNHMIYMNLWCIYIYIYIYIYISYMIYMYFTKYTENKVFSCDSPCL